MSSQDGPPGYACPCCGHLTRSEADVGTFEICSVCFWEDDDVQANDPTFGGGANEPSLETARRNFSKFGASEERCVDMVRPPRPEEIPAIKEPGPR